mgnify:CR=1 FL=1
MKSKLILWLGILLILETGLLHIMNAQHEFEEVAYMGYLFVANLFGTLVAAFGSYYKQRWGWLLGAVIGAGGGAGSVAIQGRDDVVLQVGSTVTLVSSSPVQTSMRDR